MPSDTPISGTAAMRGTRRAPSPVAPVRWLIAFLTLVCASGAQARTAVPEVTSVSPSRGATTGGTSVEISGSGFTGATEVTFGTTAAMTFVVQSDTSILADAPAGAIGLVSVTVVTPEGTSTLEEAFGYGAIPIAIPDTFNTTFDTMLTVNSPGVLTNDDPNSGGGWVAELGTDVENGTLSFTDDGGFVYTPDSGFVGSDTFTYRSRNATGFSNFATVTINIAAPLAPLPPTEFYVAEVRGNQVTVRWTPPAIGPAPTAFVIEGGPTPGSIAASITAPPNPVFTFQAPSGAYYVRVHTVAGADRSAASNEIQLFVNVPAIPAAPENLLYVVNGNVLSLAWRNSFAGGEPTSLILDVTGPVTASLPIGFTDRATFAGVPAGDYTLSLRAINPSGSSFPSSPISVTVPQACTGAPLPPTNFVAYRQGASINVLWQPAANGPAPTLYVLNVGGAFVGSFATTERGMSGAIGAGTYSISLMALNACGVSAPTTALTVTVP